MSVCVFLCRRLILYSVKPDYNIISLQLNSGGKTFNFFFAFSTPMMLKLLNRSMSSTLRVSGMFHGLYNDFLFMARARACVCSMSIPLSLGKLIYEFAERTAGRTDVLSAQ